MKAATFIIAYFLSYAILSDRQFLADFFQF
jgi:hypothetical protein